MTNDPLKRNPGYFLEGMAFGVAGPLELVAFKGFL